ncbi:MAG: hypothetical protein PWQ68_1994 [Thermoanaerobacteraceae bacterium]|jgi:hypothetical protein|nr:hypothetical protein [Thermosediminibacterales bacterium]MDN5313021.1 hypothetical protein [Thermoanaerobacteraceae bacterium]
MNKGGLYAFLFLLYVLLCHLPYMIPSLNSVSPWLGPLPFVVWYNLAVDIYGCLALYSASKNLWKA